MSDGIVGKIYQVHFTKIVRMKGIKIPKTTKTKGEL